MGVSNVNNSNMISAIKAKLAKSQRKVVDQTPDFMKMSGSLFSAPLNNSNFVSTNRTNSSQMPTSRNYMQMNGSIFNAPENRNLTDLNTNRTFADIKKSPITPTTNKKSSKNEKFADIDDASSGRAAIKEGNKIKEQVSSYTKEVKNGEKETQKLGIFANKFSATTTENDKKFKSQLKTEENNFKKDNKKIEKILKENEENQQIVDNAQHELDKLMATNSFDMSNGSGNQAKIKELQTLIGSKVGIMQKNGKMVYSLQRSQSRTLTRLNRTNRQYIRSQQVNAKTVETKQSLNNNVIRNATEIEAYSALASQSGQLLDYAGQGLIALGQATSGFFGAGAALITVGTIMSKTGKVINTLGQYGQMAANITKTVAYASDGNLMGAMQSIAAAAQTGAAAIKSTSNLKSEFGNINVKANEAKNNLAAKTVAKQTVKDMSSDELGGMTKKEMKKAIKSNLLEQMNDPNSTLTAKDLVKTRNADVINKAINTSKENFTEAVTKANGTIENGVVSGLTKKARKSISNSASSGFKNVATSTGKKVANTATQRKASPASLMNNMYSQYGNSFGSNMYGTNPYNLNNNTTVRSNSKAKVKGMSSAYKRVNERIKSRRA